VKEIRFDLMSKEVKSVLGYTPEDFDLLTFLDKIHPEDLPWFVSFENKVVDFF
jgi:hypothetical protein